MVKQAMLNDHAPQSRLRPTLALLSIVLAALTFYVILGRTAVEAPILDDYQNVLQLANGAAQAHSAGSRLLLLITYEHNGYKLMFENAVVFSQYFLLSHVRLLPLVEMGNLFALLIFFAVACMSRASGDWMSQWIYLVPVAFFIFQLQYASALNFASSSLQHLAAVAFSLVAILLASRGSQGAFVAACVTYILAIAASPNGFFAAPAVAGILVQNKRWMRIGGWLAVTGAMLGVYLFRYTQPAAPPHADSMPHGLPHINLLYALSFLGAAAARYASILPSVALGLVLCIVMGLAIQRRYYAQNPAVFYSIVFIVINAVAISGLRADLGVAQSLASRYRIYSSLMLAFSYMFIVESILPTWKSATLRRATLLSVTVLSMLFCAISDMAGARFLRQKQIALRISYARQWEHCGGCAAAGDFDTSSNPALRRQLDAGIYDVNMPVMRESVRLGVYQPPQNP